MGDWKRLLDGNLLFRRVGFSSFRVSGVCRGFRAGKGQAVNNWGISCLYLNILNSDGG